MKIDKILNYTHHPVSIITGTGTVEIPRHGMARASTSRRVKGYLQYSDKSIPINETMFGDVIGLPDEEDGTIIIVSGIAANAIRNRDDLFVVDEPVRDGNGTIVGCRALAKGLKFN
jgi:hypothetical protein